MKTRYAKYWIRVMTLCLFLLGASVTLAAEGRPVNVNTAGMAELMAIKGIGEAKARAIIEHREKHGPFRNVEELKNVSGIGDKLLATLRSQITVGEPAAPAAPQPNK